MGIQDSLVMMDNIYEGGLAPEQVLGVAAQRVCILAMKRLDRNTRIRRQAESLRDAGFRVTVVSTTPPDALMNPAGEGVEHIAIPISHPVLNGLGWILRLGERPTARLAAGDDSSAARQAHKPGDAVGRGVAETVLYPLRVVSALVVFLLLRTNRAAFAQANASLRDVLRARTSKLLSALMRPYMPKIRRIQFARKARARLRAEQFDVVQAHDILTMGVATDLARALGAKCLFDAIELFEHRSDGVTRARVCILNKWFSACDIRLLKAADAVISVSPGVGEFMADTYGIGAATIIRNCQEPWLLRADSRLRSDIGAGPDDRIVLYLNSLYPNQGFEAVLEALVHLPLRVRLVVLGRERRRGYIEECRARARAIRVEDRVDFLPLRAGDDLIQYISGADVGIIPFVKTPLNIYYSLPNRLFEMIAAGLPVIASDLPCIREIIEQYDVGVVYGCDSARSVAAALDSVISDDNYGWYSQNAAAAAQVLTWSREATRYVDLVRGLADRSVAVDLPHPRASGIPSRR